MINNYLAWLIDTVKKPLSQLNDYIIESKM